MITVTRGQVLTAGASPLDVFVASQSLLVNASSLQFALFATTGQQIFPAVGRETVDVAGANHLGLGHYCASFTVPADAIVGAAEMRWWYRLVDGGREYLQVVPCAVSDVPLAGSPAYCSVADLRAEGVSLASADDARLSLAIARASSFIERATERWFEPRQCVFAIDGNRTARLPLPAPIIAVESVLPTCDGNFAGATAMATSGFAVYARHLGGMLVPDDRQNPKLELRDSYELRRAGIEDEIFWPGGSANIQVTGVFGYTDPDGSAMGKTPDLIRWACMALAIRYAGKLGRGGGRIDGGSTAVRSERTRDQSVDYATAAVVAGGTITGDPEIDAVLESFKRPPAFAAV